MDACWKLPTRRRKDRDLFTRLFLFVLVVVMPLFVVSTCFTNQSRVLCLRVGTRFVKRNTRARRMDTGDGTQKSNNTTGRVYYRLRWGTTASRLIQGGIAQYCFPSIICGTCFFFLFFFRSW